MLQKDALMMTRLISLRRTLLQFAGTLLTLLVDACRYLRLCLRLPAGLAAENLFLRKQLALYQERHVSPSGQPCDPCRPRLALSLVRLAPGISVCATGTFLRWHRQGFRLYWRWKSRRGRPRIPAELQALIRQMAQDNPTWGQERIANELLLKLGLRVSPRTVRKYMPTRLDRGLVHACSPSAGRRLCATMRK